MTRQRSSEALLRCDAPIVGYVRCERAAGHDDPHQNVNIGASWRNEQRREAASTCPHYWDEHHRSCVLSFDHTGEHRYAVEESFLKRGSAEAPPTTMGFYVNDEDRKNAADIVERVTFYCGGLVVPDYERFASEIAHMLGAVRTRRERAKPLDSQEKQCSSSPSGTSSSGSPSPSEGAQSAGSSSPTGSTSGSESATDKAGRDADRYRHEVQRWEADLRLARAALRELTMIGGGVAGDEARERTIARVLDRVRRETIEACVVVCGPEAPSQSADSTPPTSTGTCAAPDASPGSAPGHNACKAE